MLNQHAFREIYKAAKEARKGTLARTHCETDRADELPSYRQQEQLSLARLERMCRLATNNQTLTAEQVRTAIGLAYDNIDAEYSTRFSDAAVPSR